MHFFNQFFESQKIYVFSLDKKIVKDDFSTKNGKLEGSYSVRNAIWPGAEPSRLFALCLKADIRKRSHRLLRLEDKKYKLSTGFMQVDCQNFLSTSLMPIVSKTYSKFALSSYVGHEV